MSSLINNAMSGLNAAQAALNTASNNISSYNVAGYTRQTTIMAQANSTLGAGGWVGNGVYVSGVQREYDAFITNQLRAAQTQSSGLTARYEQMSKIDNMLSTSTSSLATQMQDFFTSLQTLVSNAEDPAARQALALPLPGCCARPGHWYFQPAGPQHGCPALRSRARLARRTGAHHELVDDGRH